MGHSLSEDSVEEEGAGQSRKRDCSCPGLVIATSLLITTPGDLLATAGVGTGRDQAGGSAEVPRQLYLHLPHLKECCQGQTLSLTGMLSLEFAGLNHKCKQTRVNAQ